MLLLPLILKLPQLSPLIGKSHRNGERLIATATGGMAASIASVVAFGYTVAVLLSLLPFPPVHQPTKTHLIPPTFQMGIVARWIVDSYAAASISTTPRTLT
jgi:hypothetical protein